MLALWRSALTLFALLTVVTGVLYPLATTAIGRVVFPAQVQGSLIRAGGRVVGSRLIGQSFDAPGDFWGRLSATGPHPYNAAASSGANLGPMNPALESAVRARIDALKAADPMAQAPWPADLVTASASGLDPEISPAAAEIQVPRVARHRGLSEDVVRAAVTVHTQGRTLGLLGEPRVNVLELNRALDELSGVALAERGAR